MTANLRSSADLIEADEKCTEFKSEGQHIHPKKPKHFFQMYRYVQSTDVFMILFGIIFSILGGILQALSAVLIMGTFVEDSMLFLADIQNSTTAESKQEAAALFTKNLRNFAVYNSIVGFSIFACICVSTALISHSTIRQIYRIRLLYFKNVLNQDISWYDTHSSGVFASHMSEDVAKLKDAMSEKFSMFLFATSTMTSSVVMAFLMGWKLALVCFIPLVVIAFVIKGVTRLTSKFAKKEVDAYAAAGSIAEEVLGAIRTVVAFGGQQKEAARYSEHLDIARVYSIKNALLTGVCSIAVWICIYSGYAFGFWRGIRLVIQEEALPEREQVYDTVSIITIFFFVFQASLAFGSTSAFLEVFIAGKAAASRIFAVIDSEPVINISKNDGKKMAFVKGKIAFKNVRFSYPSRPNIPVLQGLNLVVKSGQKVALVGTSGCGKSTCIQLIQRFYDPCSGQIFVDGNNIRELDLTWLRSQIGVVGQEPILFNMTVSQNIKYGNISASQADIQTAAKIANAHAFISALPQGYDTVVGERGIKLSGGEKQRVAIARALVRKPSVLLLDEATSALDAKSQAEVQATLDKVSRNCTTIIVAHRLSTIRGADKIVVISGGKVVEEGTHQVLMEKRGPYYKLIIAQTSETESSESGENDFHPFCKYDDEKSSINKGSNDVNQVLDSKRSNTFSFWSMLKQNGPKWWVVLLACLSLMVMSSNLPIFAIIQGDIIGIFASQNHDYMKSQIGRYVTFLLATGLIIGIAAFLQTCTFSITGTRFVSRLRRQMFPAMLRQEIGWYDEAKNGVGALCAQLSGEPGRLQAASGQAMEVLVRSVTTLTLAIGLSMFYEWRLTLVSLAFAPLLFVSFFFQRRILRGLYRNEHSSLEDSVRVSVEAVSNIRTVASLGCEDVFFQSYKSVLSVCKKADQQSAFVTAVLFGFSRGLTFLAASTSMYYGGTLIRDENLPIAKVFKVVQSITKSTTNLATALAFNSNFHQAVTAANRIFQLITRVPKIGDDANSSNVKWETGDLEYSQIDFSYPTRPEAPVLKGFDMSVLQGRTVALVGPSGCGKSTVLQLLERFYNPTAGQVSVDGESISAMKLEPFRAALGIVSQEPNLFNKTIADNIAYGDNSRAVSAEEIVQAAKIANIHNFITSLPLGYDTKLGDRGVQLSGGQKQRIAIARALIRNPKVLLLDEATSALDSESEKVVQGALNNARRGRTCITIAHRLTTIQDADVICVVNNGSVTEMGTHSQLLNQKGLYYKLYNMSQSDGK